MKCNSELWKEASQIFSFIMWNSLSECFKFFGFCVVSCWPTAFSTFFYWNMCCGAELQYLWHLFALPAWYCYHWAYILSCLIGCFLFTQLGTEYGVTQHVPVPEILEKADVQLATHTVCAVVKSFDFHGSKDLYCGALGYDVRRSDCWCRNMLPLSSM